MLMVLSLLFMISVDNLANICEKYRNILYS